MRQSPPLRVEEISGDAYPDLSTAQQKAWGNIAADLAKEIKFLLAEGVLVIENGKIVPNQERMRQA